MAERDNLQKNNKVSFHVFPDDRFVDFSLYQFGWEKCKSRHSYGPAIRNHYLFHYVISGKGSLESSDADKNTHYYDFHAGQGFLICPGQVNHYHADEDEPWEYTWIEFDGLRVKEALDMAGLNVNHPAFQAVNAQESDKLCRLMLYIADHGDASTLHLTGYGFLFLDQLVQASAHRQDKKGKRIRDFYLREAMNYIEQHYQEEMSVDDLASFCGLNRSYFGKIFHEVMGKTPQEFLISYRMTKACQLLKSTQMSIKDIAAAVGYPNQLHFSRAFHTVIGSSPRDWRNKHFAM